MWASLFNILFFGSTSPEALHGLRAHPLCSLRAVIFDKEPGKAGIFTNLYYSCVYTFICLQVVPGLKSGVAELKRVGKVRLRLAQSRWLSCCQSCLCTPA